MSQAICQQWEESEAGWGVRPDGYSLHLTLDDATAFKDAFLENQRQYFVEQGVTGTPDEYSRPAGEPYIVEVSEEIVAELKKAKKAHGRSYNGRAPEPVAGGFPAGSWKPFKV